MQTVIRFFFTFSFVLVLSGVQAQMFLESQPVGTSRDGVLVVYGQSGGNNSRIPYERINGSPYWRNEYILASLIDKSNQVLGKAPVKLNLYTNEVYFLTPQGQERVAASGKVRKIIFYKDEEGKEILTVFENNLPNIVEVNPTAENPSFVQVMNSGDFQLLKHTRMQFITADSLFGTMKRYRFSDQIHYYLNNKFGQVTKLKKLSRDAVVENLNIDRTVEAWIKENGINLKKEEDVVRFLDYMNSRKKS